MSGHWQPQPYGYPQFGYPPPPPQRRRLPGWAIVLIVLGALGLIGFIAICAGLIYIGAKAPPTGVLTGTRIRQAYIDEIRQLGLIEPHESVRFFYSDALFDIKEGMYFFTDEAVIMYSTVVDPVEPMIRAEFADIIDITHEDTGSMWMDSTIWIETNEEYFFFPVSNEGGGDERFYNALRQTWQSKRGGAGR